MAKDLVTKVSQRALLYEVSRMFSELVELNKLIPFVISKTNELLRVESTAVLLLDRKKNELYFPYVADVSPETSKKVRSIRFPADRGIAGWVVRHGQPQIVPDVSKDPRWYPEVDKQSGRQTHSLLCAPLRTRNGTIGVISLRNKLEGEFTEEDQEFLCTLAGSVALAIENAILHTKLRESTK